MISKLLNEVMRARSIFNKNPVNLWELRRLFTIDIFFERRFSFRRKFLPGTDKADNSGKEDRVNGTGRAEYRNGRMIQETYFILYLWHLLLK